MWTKSRSIMLSRVMVWFFMALLAAVTILLPMLLRWYMAYTGKPGAEYSALMYTLWACVPAALAALICLERLLRNISAGQVFIDGNTRLIRAVSWCCFAVSAVMLCFCFYNVLGLLIAVAAAFMGLILRVVKNVIAKAIEIKAENDLTI